MADGYDRSQTLRGHNQSFAELGKLANTGPGTPNSGPAVLEALQRGISEFDLAAYDKHEFTTAMERNVMLRFFSSFDVFQTGDLGREEIHKLCIFLGTKMTEQEKILFNGREKVDFDTFWNWWTEYSRTAKQAFSMVSSKFSLPYHQQQVYTEESGEKFTPSYRVHFFFRNVETGEVQQVSPWHDIPLEVHDLVRTTPANIHSNRFNFICEIPKWTRAKFEIATGEAYNPIKQDLKNGVPRFYKHGDMMWNYGAFPQTWESTEAVFEEGHKGDNDPIDAIEIGMTQVPTGGLVQVKILGILGMIDSGEMDWKVICIAHSDPMAKFLDDISDVPKYLPGCLGALREWLRSYKICQGGDENKFAFEGEYRDKEFAIKIVHEAHLMWNGLKKIAGKSQV
jgi:inorganic pyrophosphatase